MRKKSIFMQLLIPMIILAAALPAAVSLIFSTSYEQEIYDKNRELSSLMAEEISIFMEEAYRVNEELADNPSILTMDTDIQTPVLSRCVERNSYLDQIYIQGTDGMQTGRSQGELADRSTRWWFVQMMEEPEAFISKSYYSVATGMPCASVFFPMYENGSLKGVYAADMKLDFLQELIGKYSAEEDGRILFVIDGEGVVVAHPDQTQIEEQYNYKELTRTVAVKDANGAPVTDDQGNIVTQQHPFEVSADMKQLIAQAMEGGSDSRKISFDGKTCYAGCSPIPLLGNSDSWSLITLQERGAAMSMVVRAFLAAAAVSAAAVAAVIIIVLHFARKLTTPVVSIAELMKDAAEGDFSVHAKESGANEVGQLAKSYNSMAGRISGALVRMLGFTNELAACSDKLHGIEKNIGMLDYAMKEISEGTSEQTIEAECVVERMAKLEQHFGELKSKSSSLLEEASAMMRSGEDGMKGMKELEGENRNVEDHVEQSFEKIKQLQDHSIKMADIIDTINSISSQTRLLALNAGIEAARAGEHGRGFAVVAESIGRLAADTSNATADIGNMITALCSGMDDIVARMEEVKNITAAQIQAVQTAGGIFSDFRHMTEQTDGLAGAMDGMIDEMYEIDRSAVNAAQHISDISNKVDDLSKQVSSLMDEEIRDVRSSVQSLAEVSGGMEQEMGRFKLKGV